MASLVFELENLKLKMEGRFINEY